MTSGAGVQVGGPQGRRAGTGIACRQDDLVQRTGGPGGVQGAGLGPQPSVEACRDVDGSLAVNPPQSANDVAGSGELERGCQVDGLIE